MTLYVKSHEWDVKLYAHTNSVSDQHFYMYIVVVKVTNTKKLLSSCLIEKKTTKEVLEDSRYKLR